MQRESVVQQLRCAAGSWLLSLGSMLQLHTVHSSVFSVFRLLPSSVFSVFRLPSVMIRLDPSSSVFRLCPSPSFLKSDEMKRTLNSRQ